ncbi:MAG: DNA mismatch repair endonuclease MutL [Bacteroidetes bacterium]|nr:DNA mismatch repair endonuclease MutL [Bacteroidota bacterium]
MLDIIRLLPDSVANQIAAGEVVQRPASAVKELLENAVDAGATSIRLIIKEAGKTLIQVIDNGCGMSERDARMCFERHATSKIQTVHDLMAIRTLGFRGEALASIASIAQVEIKSKKTEDEVGTSVRIDGSDFKEQLPATCPDGTSIQVKNLFFNVPARRNFLKSNTLELKYIIDEFFRVALVRHDIGFTFYNNDKILYQVVPGNLKQRLVALFGNQYNQRLIPVNLETDIVNIAGYIGKPEFVKKIRGEQFFFANDRFIKSPYFHHAIENAFRELIPKDAIPSYFLFLEVDPKTIDVNIHPTKTEINFQDSKGIYSLVHTAIRQAIGKFNIAPTLNFDREMSMENPTMSDDRPVIQPTITIDPEYNPFEKKVRSQSELSLDPRERSNQENWQKIFDPLRNFPANNISGAERTTVNILSDLDKETSRPGIFTAFQVQNRFLVTYTLTGIVIMDQQNAHERILYENLLREKENHEIVAQKLLLPQTIRVNTADIELFTENRKEFEALGFEIEDFGKNTYLVNSVPAGCSNPDLAGLLEDILANIRESTGEIRAHSNIQVAGSLAKSLAVKRGSRLQPEEINNLVEGLLSCKVPDVTIDGKPTMIKVSFDELHKTFK